MKVVNLEEFKRKRLTVSAAPKQEPVETQTNATVGVSSPTTEKGHARLMAAVLGLHKATVGQHAEAIKFCRVTSELGDQIRKLEQTCRRFDRNIRRIRIKPLNRAAKTLCSTMDSYLATT